MRGAGVVNRRPMPNHPTKGSDAVRARNNGNNGRSANTNPTALWKCGKCGTMCLFNQRNCRNCQACRPVQRQAQRQGTTAGDSTGNSTWKCDKCGTFNARHKNNCGKCQALRPTSIAAPEDSPWACPKCGLVNAHRSRNCVRCQCLAPVVPRTRAPGVGLTGDDWECHKCGTVNSNLKNNCKQCCALRVKHRGVKSGTAAENRAATAARSSSQMAQSQSTRQARAGPTGTLLEASPSATRARPASANQQTVTLLKNVPQHEATTHVSTAQSAAAKSLTERYSKLLQYGERLNEEREQALDDEKFERAVSMRLSLQKLSAMEMEMREEARKIGELEVLEHITARYDEIGLYVHCGRRAAGAGIATNKK